ncbi:MAG: M36 family metallopeptidase [Chloroflexi bacterium]|nr:M36 family metallopeptidase [Chloroflexota bacterium]MCI0646643.1 M36 family metallopeptidase [Chloroflexota bacterium]MCI0729226.1 M36 family metallopeptidase [Chloroflexota bacterium]
MKQSKLSLVLFLAGVLFLISLLTLSLAGGGQAAASSGSDPLMAAGAANPVHFLTGPANGDPLEIALAYLNSHYDELGLARADVADIVVSDIYTSDHNGTTHIYLQQRYQGVEVYNALINVNVAADGSIINLGNRFAARLDHSVSRGEATLSAADAVSAAAGSLGLALAEPLVVLERTNGADGRVLFSDGGISLNPIPARLVYQPLADGSVRLAWEVEIYELDAVDWWNLRLDAATGQVLDQLNYVIHDNFGAPEQGGATAAVAHAPAGHVQAGLPPADPLSGDQYNVYAMPVESPNHGGRSQALNPANITASPYAWHDTNGSPGAESNYTKGNNVDAYEDVDNNNAPTGGDAARAFGGTERHFDFPINLTQQPSTYQDAAITNLFYWNNIIHDVFYQYGFNEASGNFQENNYGRGGAASDSVNAEAQDGGGTNNANFATPVDGGNPRMQMYLWSQTSPMRDGDLDNGIIIHEYGHGISIRLTGGPNNSSCLNNQEQGGEGWSDWFGIMLTMESGDQGTDRRGVGTYVLGQPTTGTGIRTHPYTTDMSIDPRTYDTIKTAAIPHGVGSVWAAMLWEVTWGLVDQYGFDSDFYNGNGGNNIALQLVVDGLKLQPCSPGFVDARNAILLADQNNNGGANQCLLWEAFAKRGLGYSASQGSSGSRSDGTQAFDLPPACTGPQPTDTPPGPQTCTTYNSLDVPKSLPNGTSSVASNLSISGSSTIADLNASVNMTHPWVGDLRMVLTHQNTGTSVTIIDRPGVPASTYGCSGDNIATTLDDEASAPVENQCAGGTPTINGTFTPNQALSAFDGQSGNGTWVLTVYDHYTSADAGTLNSWSVRICTAGTAPPPTNTPVPPTATNTPLPPTATNTPLPPTATPTPGGAPCTNCEHYSGTLSGTGDYDYQPNGTYYYSAAGTHQGWLEGPASTDFDLYLWRWNGFTWVTVASSTSADSSESIVYNGTTGYYVWRIYSYSGSGSYDFWLDRP